MGAFLTDEWCDDMAAALAEADVAFDGPSAVLQIKVSGGDKPFTYHLVLEEGAVPSVIAGKHAEPDVAVEQQLDDAAADARNEREAVVGFMQGVTKTKGTTRPLLEWFSYRAQPSVATAIEAAASKTDF